MNNDLWMAINDLDDIQYRIHCAAELVRAVHTTITEGSSEPCENDYDAMFGAYMALDTLSNEMRGCLDRLSDAYFTRR